MVISASKITSKRQITLPLKVMQRLKLNPGDKVVFEENNGHIEITTQAEKFTIRDFVKKYHGRTAKKLTNEQLRKAREEAWHAGNGK